MENHHLEIIADKLLEDQEIILREWENLVKAKGTSTSALNSLSRRKFLDNIPAFLIHFHKSLRNEDYSSVRIAKEHGANRWDHGFDLEETVWEWRLLHKILMTQLNRYEQVLSLEGSTLKKAQLLLADRIHEGIMFSVKEYHRLQQAEAEARLRDLNQAFEEPDQFSHSENLRQTSHDIKGMLHVIRTGFFLLEREKLNKKAQELLDQMSTAADDLKQLLNDLLDLFRLDAGKETVTVERFNVHDLLEDLCKSYQPMARAENLDLKWEGPKDLQVKSDSTKVKRIVQNLVLNSLKYTKSGFVEIKWGIKKDHYWCIEISDSGPGLSATHASSLTRQSRETEPEEPSKPVSPESPSPVRTHGEGIGLIIVRRLCKLLKAVIEVETEEGKGTSYIISFPIDITKNYSE